VRLWQKIMDELVPYVIKNYSHLMTFFEAMAQKNIVIGGKIENASSDEYKASLTEKFIVNDYRVKELLKHGAEPFLQAVCERILRQHTQEVVINRCPKCNGLARTPVARQCPKCFHHWRDQELGNSQTPANNQGIQQ
jgi:hypothetical protein